jgi:hypothetical protein
MAYMHPALAEHLRKRWMRPDAYRFAAPGTPEAKPPGYLHPWAEVARQEQAAADEAKARALAEQDEFEREVLALRHELAKIRLEYELRRFQQKYSPDEPRLPAGNSDGGEWTSGGGSGAGRDAGAAPQDGESLTQDLGSPLAAASDQPPRSDLPQLQAIANDPVIHARINDAWNASNVYGILPREHGFWISRNEGSGELFTRPFANPGAENRIDPGPAPADAIAFFHTHPYGWIVFGAAPPSSSDEAFGRSVGLPGLIRSHVGMYYFGPPLRSGR